MAPDRRSDAELLALAPAADAVAAFYERHVDAVFRFAVRRCRQPADVADLVATVFVEVLGAAASYDGRRDARPWLLGIAGRCLHDQLRAGYRRAELIEKLAFEPAFNGEEYERVEAMVDAARLAPAVERALDERLTEAERELFLLVADDGLSVAEAARCLGLTAVAGRMRLARARRKLRAAVDQQAVSDPPAESAITCEGGRTWQSR
jgi:RNA polymerase sigma-70 factor (ECF subfamily)